MDAKMYSHMSELIRGASPPEVFHEMLEVVTYLRHLTS